MARGGQQICATCPPHSTLDSTAKPQPAKAPAVTSPMRPTRLTQTPQATGAARRQFDSLWPRFIAPSLRQPVRFGPHPACPGRTVDSAGDSEANVAPAPLRRRAAQRRSDLCRSARNCRSCFVTRRSCRSGPVRTCWFQTDAGHKRLTLLAAGVIGNERWQAELWPLARRSAGICSKGAGTQAWPRL